MKYFSYLILSLIVILVFTVSPVRADNPFIDLISGSKIYFSHVPSSDGWETEIAVINPTAKAASATMTFYSTSGTPIGNAVSINLPAHGRYQTEVGNTFVDAENIAYLVLTAKVLGLKGYSKFYKDGMRASIVASAPKNNGLFTKIESDGWTGIAFINTASVTANITLTAYSDQGIEMAVEPMQVPAGTKVVKAVEQIFTQSITGATYISFDSSQGVVGFFLNGSSNDTMLDGSKAL
ncbi:MAG: hypothetical protein DRH03_08205 [Deltaproteobacteria bacterium]|nr:MAG: hypothetical protein DRH03_08205 [Deltaproteobacteria bacterium]